MRKGILVIIATSLTLLTIAIVVSAKSMYPSVVADIGGGTCCGSSIFIVGVALLTFVIYQLKYKRGKSKEL